jgi:WD40 repeat protein/serine/threonine protein kinase/tetratricopeptide (TPR) repeat protein
MAMPLTCPRGHQWDAGGQAPSVSPVCPICGLAPTASAIPPTLVFQPEPLSPGDTPSNRATVPRLEDDKKDRSNPLIAQHVPGYEILGELGRGGMGVVYKARQTKLNRLVALKMILAGAQADPLQMERFRAEAEAVARLQHPYIVQIYEISDYNGCPFFSLEYVDGGTLAQKLSGAPQPPRLAAHLIRLLALAMHSAHQKGIIHRDLKPGNILLAAPCEHVSDADSFHAEIQAACRLYGIPKITDFGLAKHLDIQSQTRTGAILGTPSYMAPEQAEGRAHAIGPATDVYGLGAILYEMLTGRPPFESESSLTTIRQLLADEPVSPTQLRLKVPRDLETICLKCLEKDPARRYANAEELAEELQRFLNNQPIEARPAGWWGRSVKWMRRHPTRTTVAAVVVLAVATLLLMGLFYHLQMKESFEKTRQYAEDSRQNLIRLHVAQGTSAMNSGDGFTALLWFTEALRLDGGSPEEGAHRQRIAALEKTLPRPQQLWIHDGAINDTRFSPDGRRVLAAGDAGNVYLWDSQTGESVAGPLTEPGPVRYAVFSPDGRRVAACSQDGTARVWDADSGRPLTPLLALGGTPREVEFSPDGRQVVTAAGMAARVWDVETGQRLSGELTHHGAVRAARFSPDGRWLATGGDDGLVRLWDATMRQASAIVLPHERAVLCLAFSPDSQRLASGSADHTAQVWDVSSGASVGRRLHHHDPILHVAFSPFGKRLLTGSEDGTALIWRVGDGERLIDPLRHKSVIRWAAFSPDGCRVATAGDDNSARVWSANTGEALTPPLRANGSVNRVAFSPNGRRLAVASDDGTVRIWDVACRNQARVVEEGAVFRRRADRELRVGRLDAAPPDAEEAGRTSPDGRLVLKVSQEKLVRVCDASSGKPIAPPLAHHGVITHAAFSADGRLIVTTSTDETARVWDAASGEPVGPPLRHASTVEYADFSPGGRRLVTASDDNTARIWEIKSGELLTPPLKHDGTVLRAAFGPQGRRVATGGLDQTARVWDSFTGQTLTPPLQHPWSIRGLRFRPDGKELFTAGPTGTVWAWELPSTERPIEELVQLAQLLSGSRIDEHRGLMPMAPAALRDVWSSLRRTHGELFHFSAEEVKAWHRQTAEECARGRHWNAARWHLDRLLEQEPDNWLYRARRGRALAELAEWTQASADFAEVVRRKPDEVEAWCFYAVLRLHAGDTAEYRRACAALLSAANQLPSAIRIAYLTAWTGTLGAESGLKGEQLVKLAERGVKSESNDPDYLCTFAAALFRAGDAKTAAQRLSDALVLQGRQPHIRECLWLSLAHARLGDAKEARRWFKEATASLHARTTDHPSATEELPWVQRLQLEVLRREAERLRKDNLTK